MRVSTGAARPSVLIIGQGFWLRPTVYKGLDIRANNDSLLVGIYLLGTEGR